MRGNTSYQKTDFGFEVPELLEKLVRKTTEIAGINLKSDISVNDLRVALIDKVNNTSDEDKPVSDAVQGELNHKLNRGIYINSDFNNLTVDGLYTIYNSNDPAYHSPDNSITCWTLLVNCTSQSHCHQIAMPENSRDIYVRYKHGYESWSEWKLISAGLQDKLNTEISDRQTEDAELRQSIDDEISDRETADNALDGRIKTVESKAHAHDNMETLNSITAERVAKWDSDVEFSEYKKYIQDIIFSFTDEFQRVYGAIGIAVYDGGIYGMMQGEIALDGGGFTEEIVGNVDCGGFEPITINISESVIDGGTFNTVATMTTDGGTFVTTSAMTIDGGTFVATSAMTIDGGIY